MNFFSWDYTIPPATRDNVPVSKKISSSTSKPSYLRVSNNDPLKIVIVLDESGSMGSIRHNILKSINDLITEQQQNFSRSATLTLIKFNDNINRIIMNKPITKVNKLDYEDYTPNGSTALYDAIGEAINEFKFDNDVLMIIVTDGQENASKKYNKSQVNALIDNKKLNNNWSYVYLSSDLNTEIQGNNIGLKTSSYSANCQVQQKDFGNYIGSNINSAITKCRKTGVTVQSQLR